MKLSIDARNGSAPASGNGISPSAGTKHPEHLLLAIWAEQARKAAASLPPLPTFAEALALERETAFRELGYTFWNQELLEGMATRMREEVWLELAAGTGRLTAELSRREVAVTATDDYSQLSGRVRDAERVIEYGEWVAPLSAREAVARFRPRAVLCAWPPFGSGLALDLLAGTLPGSEEMALLVCIGEPGGATEAPLHPHELPPGWALEAWPECEAYLVSFNDPPPGFGWRTYSRLLVYRRV